MYPHSCFVAPSQRRLFAEAMAQGRERPRLERFELACAELGGGHVVNDVLAAAKLTPYASDGPSSLGVGKRIELVSEQLNRAEGRAEFVGGARRQAAELGQVASLSCSFTHALEFRLLARDRPCQA